MLLPIGFGGMATVYLARNQDSGGESPEVALKLVQASAPGFQDLAVHLLREARIVAQIRHPNVVQVIEVGEVAEGIFLAMEYVEGGTLAALSAHAVATGSPLPLSIAGRVLCDALSALHVAHELVDAEGRRLDLVHRDFSPQNILIGIDGAIKLVDFGVAKVEHTSNRTRRGLVKGTVSYMSPEQVRGHVIDCRSDVWSAGVVAWEAFAGKRLHPTQEAIAAAMSTLTGRIQRLTEARPDVPAALDEVVALALTRDPRRRLQTALEMKERVYEALSGRVASDAEVAEYARLAFAAELLIRRQRVEQVLAASAVPVQVREPSGAANDAVAQPKGVAESPIKVRFLPHSLWPLIGLTGLIAVGIWRITGSNSVPAPEARVASALNSAPPAPSARTAPNVAEVAEVASVAGGPSLAPTPGSARPAQVSELRSPAKRPQPPPVASAKPHASTPPRLADNPYEKSPPVTQ